jgi:hypothetical protein
MNDDTERQNLNAPLQMIDTAIQGLVSKPDEQLGVLMIACVLAVRRLLAANGVTDRGRRVRVIRAAVASFEAKLRRHAHEPPVNHT